MHVSGLTKNCPSILLEATAQEIIYSGSLTWIDELSESIIWSAYKNLRLYTIFFKCRCHIYEKDIDIMMTTASFVNRIIGNDATENSSKKRHIYSKEAQ